jgi:methyltransferase
VSAVVIVVALVALQRLGELVYAARNTRALLARGGVEHGKRHYPLFVALHAGWLIAIVVAVPPGAPIVWLPLSLFVIMQALRLWVIGALGPYWTTRIVSLPEAPLVQGGPYRFLRHPNYVIVIGEIALLPLAFGAWRIAVLFSLLNLALLAWRIRIEERALAPRRARFT